MLRPESSLEGEPRGRAEKRAEARAREEGERVQSCETEKPRVLLVASTSFTL